MDLSPVRRESVSSFAGFSQVDRTGNWSLLGRGPEPRPWVLMLRAPRRRTCLSVGRQAWQWTGWAGPALGGVGLGLDGLFRSPSRSVMSREDRWPTSWPDCPGTLWPVSPAPGGFCGTRPWRESAGVSCGLWPRGLYPACSGLVALAGVVSLSGLVTWRKSLRTLAPGSLSPNRS